MNSIVRRAPGAWNYLSAGLIWFLSLCCFMFFVGTMVCFSTMSNLLPRQILIIFFVSGLPQCLLKYFLVCVVMRGSSSVILPHTNFFYLNQSPLQFTVYCMQSIISSLGLCTPIKVKLLYFINAGFLRLCGGKTKRHIVWKRQSVLNSWIWVQMSLVEIQTYTYLI